MIGQATLVHAVRTLLAVAVVGLLVAACGGGDDGSSPTAPRVGSIAEIEFSSFQLANAAREDSGVEPQLSFDELVGLVARGHSETMRDEGFFGHNGPGGGLGERLRSAGVQFSDAAENLAKLESVNDPAGVAHSYFLNSPAHRSIMLDGEFRLAGVGVARSGDNYWLTQIYIRR